jgi:hypothetical protein
MHMTSAEFIHPESPVWQECLDETPHDFYHMPGYVQLCAESEHGSAEAFVVDDGRHRFFLPLIVRPIKERPAASGELHDAGSPYGYPAPLLTGGNSQAERAAFLDGALQSLLVALRERRIVSLCLRLHPLLPLPREPFCRHGTLVRHGETVFVDLAQSEQELWHNTRPQHRNHINRAIRCGFVAEIDREWTRFDDFFDLYTATMRRVDADPGYFFSRDYFRRLKQALGDSLHLGVVRLGDATVCAGVFSEICGIVQFHLGGRRQETNANAPMKLLTHFARRWAKERGNRVFHLGGGLSAREDSLFFFKSGFSKLRSEFFTWRAVIDDEAYRALVAERFDMANARREAADDFFPAYRQTPRNQGGLTSSGIGAEAMRCTS